MAKAKKIPSGSWRVQLYVGKDPSGKRIYKSFTASTKKEAEFMAAQYQMGIDQEKAAGIPFLQAAESYISDLEHVRSPWTITSYRRILAHDLVDLHAMRCPEITSNVVQRFINMFAIDHSPKTVRNVHSFIGSVLRFQDPSVTLHTKLPAKVKTDFTIPTDDQILQAIRMAHGPMPLIIQIAASLGLRRGEIAALTWGDIVGDRLSVNKAYAKAPGNVWVIKAPKSYAGTRTLSIPPALLSALLAYRPESATNADEIFQINPNYITKHWSILCRQCGFECRFHDLRHYNASVMLSLGIPDKYAMSRIGHASTHMLKAVYQHLIDEREREAAAKMDSYMAKFSEMQHEMQHEIQQAQ